MTTTWASLEFSAQLSWGGYGYFLVLPNGWSSGGSNSKHWKTHTPNGFTNQHLNYSNQFKKNRLDSNRIFQVHIKLQTSQNIFGIRGIY